MEVMEEMNNAEIIKETIAEFSELQTWMKIAKDENAQNIYETMKVKYLVLKTTLQALGVNLTEIDKIKE